MVLHYYLVFLFYNFKIHFGQTILAQKQGAVTYYSAGHRIGIQQIYIKWVDEWIRGNLSGFIKSV